MILRHEVNGAAHFDLMLEVEGEDRLLTWQLARWPLAVGESCPAPELPPHRRHYLDFEGEISGGRGQVTRVAAGTWAADGDAIVLHDGIALHRSDTIVTRLR